MQGLVLVGLPTKAHGLDEEVAERWWCVLATLDVIAINDGAVRFHVDSRLR